MTRRPILSDFPQPVFVGRKVTATLDQMRAMRPDTITGPDDVVMEYLTRRARKIDSDLPPCAALPAPVTVYQMESLP